MGQNGTGDKKNSDDEDIMFFIDDVWKQFCSKIKTSEMF